MIFLVPISLALLGVAVWAFVWAVRRGQFDDLETPAVQILVDEPCRGSSEADRDSGDTAGPDEARHAPSTPDDDERHPPRAD